MNQQKSRWPTDPVWLELEKAKFGGERQLGLREKKIETTIKRIVAQFIGALSSFAALTGETGMGVAARRLLILSVSYLKDRDETFTKRVAAKLKRLIGG